MSNSDSYSESDAPLMHPRVTYVSRHVTKIEPCSDLLKMWLEESERAAKHRYEIPDDRLVVMTKDDRDEILVNTGGWDYRNQYLDVLASLGDELTSAPEKAELFRELAEAMELPDKNTWLDDVEIVLRGKA